MIEERAAAGAIVERPAERVLHQARPVLVGRDLPQLLEADAVLLRLAALGELELPDELLGQRAARAFGDERVLAAQLHAAHEVVGRLAVAADAHVAGGDADHGAVLVVKHFGCSEAGIDLDAELGGLLAEPVAERAEADDVVAVIVHQRRHDEVRQAHDRPQARERGIDLRVTGVSTGAPLSFQSGIRRLRPMGSMTAPDRI